ncbi:MAG: F0F1 ATP synthase subunit B [Xanthomonadales bacterium]|nr:F0F1 ATP synthase subunit B [Xanthomonadales bacterium]
MSLNATFLGQLIFFAILIWFTWKFIWPPLMRAVEERQRRIAEGLAAAERSRKALEEAEDQVAAMLREARSRAGEIIDQAHQRASQIVEQARAEALAEAERQRQAAQAELEQAVHRAREQLRAELAELAVLGARRILEREIDPASHRELLERLAGELRA